MNDVILLAQKEFEEQSENLSDLKVHLRAHIKEMIRWAYYMNNKYPQSNLEVIIVSVYMHDMGHCFQKINYANANDVNTEIRDHAVISEEYAAEFLKSINYKNTKEVLHCVRAHRNKDIHPETLEAKIIATTDSASHITGGVYFDMATKIANVQNIIDKIKRDYRDLGFFPEIQKEMKPICDAWEKLIIEYKNLNILNKTN